MKQEMIDPRVPAFQNISKAETSQYKTIVNQNSQPNTLPTFQELFS
jgi:hypothetical protein